MVTQMFADSGASAAAASPTRARGSAVSENAKLRPAADVLRKSRRLTWCVMAPSLTRNAAAGASLAWFYWLGGRIPQSRGGVCPLQALGQEPQQAWRHEASVAAGLVDRVAQPVVRGAVYHTGPHLELGLLERLKKHKRLRSVIDHIVLGAPDQEHGGLVVGDDGVAERGGVEIDAAILDGRDPQHALDQIVAGVAELRVAPLRKQIIDAVAPDQHFRARALRSMRIAWIAVREQRAVAGERHQRRKMRARGIAPEREARRIEPEVLGAAAHELHRRADVMHHPRIGLLAGLGQPVADRKAGIAAGGEIRSPILVRVARAAPPVAAMHVDEDRERPGPGRQIE